MNVINFSQLKLFFKSLIGLAPQPLSKCIKRLETSFLGLFNAYIPFFLGNLREKNTDTISTFNQFKLKVSVLLKLPSE